MARKLGCYGDWAFEMRFDVLFSCVFPGEAIFQFPYLDGRIMPRQSHTLLLFALVLYSPWLIGILFPANWWGTHWLSFLPGWQAALFLIVPLFVGAAWMRFQPTVPTQVQALVGKLKEPILLLGAAIMGLLFFLHPIAFDFYGDAFRMVKFLDLTCYTLDAKTVDHLMSFSLKPRAGEEMVSAIITSLAVLTGLKYSALFQAVGVITGVAFSWLWLRMVDRQLASPMWKLAMALVGISAPVMMNFCMHLEFYSLFLVVLLAWFGGLLRVLQAPAGAGRWKPLLWLIPLWLVGVKLHTIMLLTAPALGLGVMHALLPDTRSASWFSWKRFGWWLFLPGIVGGLVLYLIVLQDHVDPRIVTNGPGGSPIFLPLFSPDAPLDRYNLLSFNHLFDLLNIGLLYSPALLLVTGAAVVVGRRTIRWNDRGLVVVASTLVFMLLLLAAVNPLVSLPLDWDLFMVPVPLLLIACLQLLRQVEANPKLRPAAGWAMGLSVLCLAIPLVNSNRVALSQRYEVLGNYQFRTYWQRSSETLRTAFVIDLGPEKENLQRMLHQVQELEPYAMAGNDYEYALLLTYVSKMLLFTHRDPVATLRMLDQAEKYWVPMLDNGMYRMQANFELQKFNAAYELSVALMAKKYPNHQQAIRTAIHCGLEAGHIAAVRQHVADYLKMWPNDEQMLVIANALETGGTTADVLRFFKQR